MAFELGAASCSYAEFWRVIVLQGTPISTISAALPAGATATGYEARLFLHILDQRGEWVCAQFHCIAAARSKNARNF